MYADVLVEIISKGTNKTFTYYIPSNMKAHVGMKVKVPFGKRVIEGFIINIHNNKPEYEVKNIISISESTILNKEMLKLGEYISKKTLSPLTLCYQTMLPSALKAKEKNNVNKKMLKYLKVLKEDNLTSEKQKEVFDFVKKNSYFN